MNYKRTIVGLIILNVIAVICLIYTAFLLVIATNKIGVEQDQQKHLAEITLDCSRPEGREVWTGGMIGLREDNQFAIYGAGKTTIVEVKDSWACVIGPKR